ncbi:MAG: hypothetical protein FJW40_23815 [Acidobacteria bacterium]|nr:hypothetical protein [Acidobacteriota bacterium]
MNDLCRTLGFPEFLVRVRGVQLSMMRVFGYGLLLAVAPVASVAQTAATGTVIGIVTDPNGAAVPGAQLTLREANAGSGRQTESNAEGQFVYTSVLPGTYRLTAFKQGFRPLIAEDIRVEVAKSSNVEIALQVGVIAEAITVTPGASVELQTLDATVGAVLKGEPALRVPTINRSAGALFAIQPLVAPSRGLASPANHGQVAGARSDQNAFHLDGADATDTVAGSGTYVRAAIDFASSTPSIPVPLESVEEFRILTTNPNAAFGRSMGAQVSMITKRGTNDLHGSAYWYHQNDNLNANSWTFNRLGIRRPELKDNRYGTSLGGPVLRNRTFLYVGRAARSAPAGGHPWSRATSLRSCWAISAPTSSTNLCSDTNGTTGLTGASCPFRKCRERVPPWRLLPARWIAESTSTSSGRAAAVPATRRTRSGTT